MKRPRAQQARTSTVAAIVVGISLAVYLRSLDFEFTYDDHHHFVRNPFVQDLGNLSRLLPWRFFDQEFPDQARPVLVLTHFLDRWLGGSSAVCHLQSALWHAATAGLVFALGRSLGFALRTAGLAGVLFGLHPALVEAVAGISNREDVLAAFFGLAALLGARRVLTGDLSSLGLVAAAFAVALLSKESALAIPLLCLTLALCSPRFRPRERPRRAWLALGLAFGLVTAGWAAFQLRLGYPSLLPAAGGTGLERAAVVLPLRTLAAWQAPPASERRAPEPGARRRPQGEIALADAPALQAFRAWQLVVPWPTAPEYDLTPFRTPWARLLGTLALALLAAALWRDLRARGRVALGIAWFFAASVPIAVPTLLLNPLADRYLYLPAVGAALTLAWLIAERVPDALSRPAMLGTGLGFFALTSANLLRFRDDVALFSAATESAPRSARAQQNLGSALLRKERIADARVALQKAVELDPNLLAARVNLGLLEEVRGDSAAALGHYQKAVELPRVVAEQKLAGRACERLGALGVSSGQRGVVARQLALERERDASSPCARALEQSLEAR
ncbi:MAG: hypothetical protein KJ015_34215 [Myxococcales bacterium]|nr:hypothetical protein [Myxococcales bacterium]